MSVTSAEVARVAGVSRATVSYVLNDKVGQTVSAQTRATVLRVARELGYRPNVLARSLRRGRGNGVLFPLPGLQLIHPLACMLDACTSALEPLGLSLIRDFTSYDDPEQQLEAWTRLAPAAVIDVLLRHDDPVVPALRGSGIPVLSAALPTDSGWETSGDVFAREQRLTQMRYLLSQGHRRIALVAPRLLPVDPRTEKKLLSALRRLARASGATLETARVELEAPALRELVAGWREGRLPDAVAAHNDDYAIALVSALSNEGIAVPGDLAVMGIDDLPLGRVVTPTVTTLAGDFDAFAQALARIVNGILTGAPADEPLPAPGHRLIVRESA